MADQTNNLLIFEQDGSGNFTGNTRSLISGDTAVSAADWSFSAGVTIAGNLTVNGTTTTVDSTVVELADNIFAVNSGPSGSKNAGMVAERYQTANDAGTGDVVTDSDALAESFANIGDQTGAASTEIYLTGGSASDDYYNGMYVKVTSGLSSNQVREITDYDGTSKTATLATAWTTQNPSSGDSAEVYSPFVGVLFDETNDGFVTALMTGRGGSDAVIGNKLDLAVGDLTVDAAATVGGTLGVTGDLSVNTNKFSVTAASGNTSVAGTLSVTSTSTFTGAATFDAGLTIGGGQSITADAGNLNVYAGMGGASLYLGANFTSVVKIDESVGLEIQNFFGLGFADEATMISSIKDEDNLVSDSNTALATQQSIKAYVDNQVAQPGSTTALTFTINTDADSGTDEDPGLILKGGGYGADEAASVFTTTWTQIAGDSGVGNGANPIVELKVDDDGSAVASLLHIGESGQLADLQHKVVFNGGTGAAVSTGEIEIDGGAATPALTVRKSGTGVLELIGADDINADAQFGTLSLKSGGTDRLTVDTAGVLSIDGADTTSLSMAANDAGAKVLTLSATNAGGGEAQMSISATDQLDIGDGTATLTFDAGAVSESGMTSLSLTPSGAITLTAGAASTWSTSSGELTLTSAAAATWSTSAGALTISGNGGLNLQKGGADVIVIDTNHDVLFGQMGGSTDDPDVEFDGYTRFDGSTEFDGSVQVDGALDINNDTTVAADKEYVVEGYPAATTGAPSNNELVCVVDNGSNEGAAADGVVKARQLDVSSGAGSFALARGVGVWRTGGNAVLSGNDCAALLVEANVSIEIGNPLYASTATNGRVTTTGATGMPGSGDYKVFVGVARSQVSGGANQTAKVPLNISEPVQL